MKRRIRFSLALATVAALSMSAASIPASASHRCALEDVSHTVNAICDNYHSPKVLIPYLVCIATGDCPIS